MTNRNQFRLEELQNGTVHDASGNKVGKVGQIYLDDASGQPTFATVNTGFFGTKESFVPLRGASVRGDEIHVTYDKDFIKDAPQIEDSGHISETEQDELFRYYSYDGDDREGDLDQNRRGDDAERGSALAGGVAGDRDADLDRSVVRDRGADLDRDAHLGEADRGDQETIVRREEELRVGTERVQTGRLRIRKHVVTEQQTVTVPVEREEVEIIREPIADGGRSGGGTLEDGEIEVTLTEERPVINKEVVDKERIGVDRRTVTQERDVTAEVSKEEIDVDRDSDLRDTDGTGGKHRR